MRLLAASALLLCAATVPAQTAAHARGVAHTPQIDIAYQTLGRRGTALPLIAVNGGPGLTHAYMVQNDLWDRMARQRLVVFYDQRGTGASRPRQAPHNLRAIPNQRQFRRI